MATENKYQYTKGYFKILDLIQSNSEEDVFIIRGGQGASKTISIIQLIIQSLLSSTKEATILSSELSKMKRTVIRDYKKIAKDWGVLNSNDFNKSESKHEYPNESYLDFLGADVNDVGKGFRRDILYINEADKMDIDTAVQFISRCDLTIIDYNPDKMFWGDDYINKNNFLTLTFEDNEFLSESERKSILDYKQKGFFNPELPRNKLFEESNVKSKYWANKWKVYGLGELGSLQGVVYENWQTIDQLPKDAKLLGYGMDFGFTNDPSALVAVYRYNSELIVDECIYQTGLLNSDIIRLTKPLEKAKIYADSAEPKSIAELQRGGLTIYPVKKGKDSLEYGIQLLQDGFKVTKRSVNIIKELQGYTWKTDRAGNTTNQPIDAFNHALDALRYWALMVLGVKKQSKYRGGNYGRVKSEFD